MAGGGKRRFAGPLPDLYCCCWRILAVSWCWKLFCTESKTWTHSSRSSILVTTHPIKTTLSLSKGLAWLSLVVFHIERITQKASEPPTARKPLVPLSLTFTGRAPCVLLDLLSQGARQSVRKRPNFVFKITQSNQQIGCGMLFGTTFFCRISEVESETLPNLSRFAGQRLNKSVTFSVARAV